MSKALRWGGTVLVAALIATVFAAWPNIAPPALGGKTSVFITKGASMAPLLEQGDLAVVRQSDNYAVGDVVAYKSEQLGQVVLHRVVAVDSGRLQTKGDANSEVDTDRPAPSEVTGKLSRSFDGLWLRPEAMASGLLPAAFSAAVAIATFMVAMARRPRKPNFTQGSGNPRPAPNDRAGALGLTVTVVLFLVIVASLSASGDRKELAYNHMGRFEYSGKAAGEGSNVVYPDGLKTGQPAYLNLIHDVDVGFSYNLSSDADFDGGGSMELQATLRNQSGWSAQIPMASTSDFTGPSGDISGRLNLASLAKLANDLQGYTGTAPQSYSVDISPVVRVNGKLGGQDLGESFAPVLTMRLDPSVLQMDTSRSDATSALQQSKGGLVAVSSGSASGNDFIKRALMVMLAFAAVATIAVAVKPRRDNRIAFQGSTVVECESLGEIAHLALTENVGINEHTSDGRTTYIAQHQGTTYRFTESVS